MPKHPDKILSYQDSKFLDETFKHCRAELLDVYDLEEHSGIEPAPILSDIKRCIKILEDCKDAQ